MPATQTENCPACGTSLDVTGAQIFAERTCPVCGTPINVRRKFGHYELMEVLGHGGQGLVFKAVDNNLNRLVALKLLRTEYAEDPEFVRQFESEAQVTASINHPNVVRVFSFGADEGHVYLAMEMVANGTLDDLMEKRGRLPEARIRTRTGPPRREAGKYTLRRRRFGKNRGFRPGAFSGAGSRELR
jgi:hypothetical protein